MKNTKPELLKLYDKESAKGFFINAVISARIDTGFRSNTFCMDEDVNIYLAQLLAEYTSDEYRTHASQYICLYESELIERQEGRTDIRERYNLYKYTADHILFTAGMYRGFNRDLPKYKSAFRLDNDIYLSRARSYYQQAANYREKLNRSGNAVSDVMRKISENFNFYLNILYHIRDQYFHFIEGFSEGEWFHFVHKNIIHRKGVDSKVYVALLDDFLEKISAWKLGHTASDKDMLRIMCAELKRLNPEFHYDIETLFTVQRTATAA